jgi:hypothetical protein
MFSEIPPLPVPVKAFKLRATSYSCCFIRNLLVPYFPTAGSLSPRTFVKIKNKINKNKILYSTCCAVTYILQV